MRKLLSLSIAILFAGTLGACEEGPTTAEQQQTMDNQTVAANNAADGTPPAERGLPPLFRTPTWGNEHLWEFSAPPNDVLDTGDASHAPFYVIGPVDPQNPHATAFFGPHDHTIPVPPQNKGTFSAIWHIEQVVKASDSEVVEGQDVLVRNGFVAAADLNDNDQLDLPGEYLDSDWEVEKAEEMGLVEFVDTEVVFKCPVRDIEG